MQKDRKAEVCRGGSSGVGVKGGSELSCYSSWHIKGALGVHEWTDTHTKVCVCLCRKGRWGRVPGTEKQTRK